MQNWAVPTGLSRLAREKRDIKLGGGCAGGELEEKMGGAYGGILLYIVWNSQVHRKKIYFVCSLGFQSFLFSLPWGVSCDVVFSGWALASRPQHGISVLLNISSLSPSFRNFIQATGHMANLSTEDLPGDWKEDLRPPVSTRTGSRFTNCYYDCGLFRCARK